jgi:hypothetical protein
LVRPGRCDLARRAAGGELVLEIGGEGLVDLVEDVARVRELVAPAVARCLGLADRDHGEIRFVVDRDRVESLTLRKWMGP